MSQVNNATIPLRDQIRGHWVVALSALLALAATVAVLLVLVIDGGSTSAPVSQTSQSAARADGGPEESAVAASVGAASEPATGRIKVSPTIRHN
jgi:hypothetical protein